MGYRHQMISDTMVPSEEMLPKWFTDKYGHIVDFSGSYWRSYDENKRYSPPMCDFEEDIQKILSKANGSSIRLVYFADEGNEDYPDIIHIHITQESINTLIPSGWVE